jgi:osmotically inducible protein OsmC
MSLSGVLTRAETPPERLEARAVVTLDEVAERQHRITTIDLSVVGHVHGIDDETFQAAARQAEQGCPVSNVLNAEIKLDARLAS